MKIAILKANKYVIAMIVIVLIIIFSLYFGVKLFRSEMKRVENNYLSTLQELRNENIDNMRVLDLKLSEIKQQYPEIQKQLKDMDIKIKNVETIQNINTITKTNVNTVLRDTIIQDTSIVKVATYKDVWTDFKLLIIDDSIHSSIQTRDSLFIVLNKYPRTFKEWITAQPKQVRSTVKNYNPNSIIVYNRLIKINK